MSDREWIELVDETVEAAPAQLLAGWKVLIVDDDDSVHSLTRLALEGLSFQGRPITFLSAYTGLEGYAVLTSEADIGVVLLDVVMESDDAGLVLAKRIREELDNREVRIILRTGQPGSAPEERVILEYDIHDYKSKTDLTVRMLRTAVISGLRSFRDIQIIERNKHGLEMILDSSPTLFQRSSLKRFTEGVLTQTASLLQVGNGFFTRSSGFAAEAQGEDFAIVCGIGPYTALENQPTSVVLDAETMELIRRAALTRSNLFAAGHYILFFSSELGTLNMIFLEGSRDLAEWEKRLLEVFLTNVAAAYDNLQLNREIEASQREIIFTLGELTEARSPETGSHVKRVSESVRLLAKLFGLDEHLVEQVALASALHDVGKVSIPDSILKSPLSLQPEERELMKAHTTIGQRLLAFSQRPILKLAATIAGQHHEKWNGTGYPRGLKGEEIDLAARMTTLVDVFDALSEVRVYRQPLSRAEIEAHWLAERGQHFDPVLTDLFLANLDQFYALKWNDPLAERSLSF